MLAVDSDNWKKSREMRLLQAEPEVLLGVTASPKVEFGNPEVWW